jgi:phosphatidylserine decarboxylase
MMEQLFVLLQRLMPKYVLTALVYRLARLRTVAIKNALIRGFIALYRVDVSELRHPVPDGYATFNDFFIRELADGARDFPTAADAIASPVDGTVSAAGAIQRNELLQAKGIRYSLEELLATDLDEAQRYAGGAFATIYLAPYNYHRIHAPVAGRLVTARYVPGALYSVNEATVRNLPGLFARNERLICHLHTEGGPMVVIFVGALNVGTINSRWTGDIRPRDSGVVEQFDPASLATGPAFDRGDTLGWFNMGSTVILLVPPGTDTNFDGLQPGRTLRVGEPIGRMTVG